MKNFFKSTLLLLLTITFAEAKLIQRTKASPNDSVVKFDEEKFGDMVKKWKSSLAQIRAGKKEFDVFAQAEKILSMNPDFQEVLAEDLGELMSKAPATEIILKKQWGKVSESEFWKKRKGEDLWSMSLRLKNEGNG